ncbi:transglutaminase N-terminal domain-containing protein [Spongisporangium articulatum]|uniref:Transglutaminase N-terminal domain-containing protein n=1 Tax=Spongisporangium articulatum TaxID=3362603 RepID=A0ABW8AH38_9ACTN
MSETTARTYRVRHVTTYEYEDDVTSSYGWAYLTPRDAPGQQALSAEVTVAPAGLVANGQPDFFGNHASYFEVHTPHRKLVVTAESRVVVDRPRFELATLDDVRWDEVGPYEPFADVPDAPMLAAHYRLESPRLAIEPVATLARSWFTPGRPLGEALHALVHGIYAGFRYRSGVTTVTSSLSEVLARREGVCQDFAHIAVAAIRWAGLPARYVSGYVETTPPPGQPKLQGADASHAWVSVLVPGIGWVDLDPTNDGVVDSAYVVTAWGREYTDVPPLKGVIFTESANSTLSVAVDVERL